MPHLTNYIEKLKKTSRSEEIKLTTIIDTLINLNKRISEIKKITMETTPIELLNTTNYHSELINDDFSKETCENLESEPTQILRSLITDFLNLSSIIMGDYSKDDCLLLNEEKLFDCIISNRYKLRACVLKILMKWLKDDTIIRRYKNIKEKTNFSNSCFFPVSLSTYIVKSILTSSMQHEELSKIILNREGNKSNDTFIMENILLDEYIKNYKDLKCYILKHILNLVLKCIEDNKLLSNDIDFKRQTNNRDKTQKLTLCTIICLRVQHILVNLQIPTKNEVLFEEEHKDSLFIYDLDEECSETIQKLNKNYRTIYQKLWLTFIRLIIMRDQNNCRILPLPILKNTLEYVSENIIPIISNPLELADIFKSFFDGINDDMSEMDKLAFSVISLNGIFYLIVNSRLNESSLLNKEDEEGISTGYYSRLYEILTPPIFLLKSKESFLKLLSMSLLSPLIPMTVLCCFIKKLIRISLFTSINNTVFIIALVNTLIKKHKNSLFPIISINENQVIYKVIKNILEKQKGELWSYELCMNSFRNNNLFYIEGIEQKEVYNSDLKKEDINLSGSDSPQKNEMEVYLSSNFALWEIYLLEKSVVPVIRYISNTLTLNASNAKVNHRIYNLNYEELVGINTEDILNHEMSSDKGLINACSSCFNKNKQTSKNITHIIPHNYIENDDPYSSVKNQVSDKLFTNSDFELLSLI